MALRIPGAAARKLILIVAPQIRGTAFTYGVPPRQNAASYQQNADIYDDKEEFPEKQ